MSMKRRSYRLVLIADQSFIFIVGAYPYPCEVWVVLNCKRPIIKAYSS